MARSPEAQPLPTRPRPSGESFWLVDWRAAMYFCRAVGSSPSKQAWQPFGRLVSWALHYSPAVSGNKRGASIVLSSSHPLDDEHLCVAAPGIKGELTL